MFPFDEIMRKAKAGDTEAVASLLREFEPVIVHYATIEGTINEDLRHLIIANFIDSINNFKEI